PVRADAGEDWSSMQESYLFAMRPGGLDGVGDAESASPLSLTAAGTGDGQRSPAQKTVPPAPERGTQNRMTNAAAMHPHPRPQPGSSGSRDRRKLARAPTSAKKGCRGRPGSNLHPRHRSQPEPGHIRHGPGEISAPDRSVRRRGRRMETMPFRCPAKERSETSANKSAKLACDRGR